MKLQVKTQALMAMASLRDITMHASKYVRPPLCLPINKVLITFDEVTFASLC